MKVIDRGKKRYKISPKQKGVLPSHKLQDHAYEYQNPFGSKEDNLPQKNCQNQLSHPSLSHAQQECHESLIQRKIYIQQNLNKDLKCW